MVAQIQYGGRITDDLDQLLMNTYAESFFNQVILLFGLGRFLLPGNMKALEVNGLHSICKRISHM